MSIDLMTRCMFVELLSSAEQRCNTKLGLLRMRKLELGASISGVLALIRLTECTVVRIVAARCHHFDVEVLDDSVRIVFGSELVVDRVHVFDDDGMTWTQLQLDLGGCQRQRTAGHGAQTCVDVAHVKRLVAADSNGFDETQCQCV